MKNFYSSFILAMAMLLSLDSFSLPKLNSYTSATATIYLDFDGEFVTSPLWNGGNNFTCLPAGLSDIQITEIFNRVSEDYRPFNVNITTDYETFLAAPLDKRMRVIVTPTSAWFTGVGGVSYIGSFNWGDDTPCFVFCDRLTYSSKMVAECCSHESGHTLGLTHQSKYDAACNLTATYNEGLGSGEVSWAPIMGNSYYRNMSGWSNGPTPYGCSYVQDNLTIITTKNGFTYRDDDFNNDINANPEKIDPLSISIDGLISTNSDKDAFQFELKQGSNFIMDAEPFSIGNNNDGADLDIKVSLYNSGKQLIREYNPENSMSVSIDTILTQGTYYMIVDGTGNSYAKDYGSLGSYKLRGLTGILPIRSVSLTGLSEQGKHNLTWNIVSDDAIKSITIESSADGIHFNTLNSLNTNPRNFSYTPNIQNDIYYRLKVSSASDQTMYSNSIRLKSSVSNRKDFIVSTFVHNDISIQATEKFQYLITDLRGNVFAKGNGTAGLSKLNIEQQPSGMYVLQLLKDAGKQTERIIKQ